MHGRATVLHVALVHFTPAVGVVLGVVLTPDPEPLLIVDAVGDVALVRDLGHVGALRNSELTEAGRPVPAAVSSQVGRLTCTERLDFAIVFIDTVDPNVIIPFASECFFGPPAVGHAQLEWVVLIALTIVSAVTEVAIEDVAAAIDLATLRHRSCVVLASSNVHDLVTLLNSVEVVLNLTEAIDVAVAVHARREHVLAILPVEEYSAFLGKDHAEELAMGDLPNVTAALGRLNLPE